MRSHVLLTIALVLCLAPCSAQRIAFGLKGGAIGSKAHAYHVQTMPVAGATAGLYVPYAIGRRVELQPEVLAAYMGSGFQEPDGDRYTVRSLYLQVPLSLKIFVHGSLNLQGGFHFGWLLAAYREAPEGTSVVTDRYQSMDRGLNGGLGLDLRSGWDITARYYSGMEPILIGDQALFPRNRSVQVTIGRRLMEMRKINAVRRRP